MNERIKDLLQQSTYPYEPYDRVWVFSKVDQAKFAGLIVRECISMIENEAAQYAEPVWAVELVNDIKERFGVEQ